MCCPALEQGNKAPSPPTSIPPVCLTTPVRVKRSASGRRPFIGRLSQPSLNCVPSAQSELSSTFADVISLPSTHPLFLLALQVNPSISFQKTPSRAPNMALARLAWRSTAACLLTEAGRFTVSDILVLYAWTPLLVPVHTGGPGWGAASDLLTQVWSNQLLLCGTLVSSRPLWGLACSKNPHQRILKSACKFGSSGDWFGLDF